VSPAIVLTMRELRLEGERDRITGEERCDNEAAEAPQRARAEAHKFGCAQSLSEKDRSRRLPVP
jgi:hypothetical protein